MFWGHQRHQWNHRGGWHAAAERPGALRARFVRLGRRLPVQCEHRGGLRSDCPDAGDVSGRCQAQIELESIEGILGGRTFFWHIRLFFCWISGWWCRKFLFCPWRSLNWFSFLALGNDSYLCPFHSSCCLLGSPEASDNESEPNMLSLQRPQPGVGSEKSRKCVMAFYKNRETNLSLLFDHTSEFIKIKLAILEYPRFLDKAI